VSDRPDQDQKTEQPTEKKRRDAARDGDVLKSKELLIAATMLGGIAYLTLAGQMLFDAVKVSLSSGLTLSRAEVHAFDVAGATTRLLLPLALPFTGLLLATVIAAVGGQAMLGGIGFAGKAIAFKASRMNPLAGFKRMFSMNALIELLKSLLKVTLIGAIGLWALIHLQGRMLALATTSVEGAIASLGGALAIALLALCGGLALVAAVDVPVQYLQRLRNLRMTKEEVKDEHKQSEGSPQVRQAIRRRQREAIRRDVRKGVQSAHVVMTNPTHFAVALRYEAGRDRAPVVVAAGKGETAAIIRELAEAGRVPMLSYPELTRALYFTSKVGEEVRSDLYFAVAVVLAFVFEVDRDLGRAPPDVTVPPDVRFDENGERQ
jgi:flagellar biosynthesis protein FlhB